jgi:hypothetical protein
MDLSKDVGEDIEGPDFYAGLEHNNTTAPKNNHIHHRPQEWIHVVRSGAVCGGLSRF